MNSSCNFNEIGESSCENDQREGAGQRLLPRKMDEVFHGSAPLVLFSVKIC